MVVRIDPAKKTAKLLSFPRDLWVPDLGHRRQPAHQHGLQQRPPAADQHHRAGLRHPHQPLRRGQLRQLPRRGQRHRRRAAVLQHPDAGQELGPQHRDARLRDPQRRPGAVLRPVPPPAVLRHQGRLLEVRRHRRPGPHHPPADLHPHRDRAGRGQAHGPQPHRHQQPGAQRGQEPQGRLQLHAGRHARPDGRLQVLRRQEAPDLHPAHVPPRDRRRRRRAAAAGHREPSPCSTPSAPAASSRPR